MASSRPTAPGHQGSASQSVTRAAAREQETARYVPPMPSALSALRDDPSRGQIVSRRRVTGAAVTSLQVIRLESLCQVLVITGVSPTRSTVNREITPFDTMGIRAVCVSSSR